MRHRRFEEESTTGKSIIIFILIFILFFSTSIVLTSYPQHLALSNGTVIQAIKFIDEKTVLIKGNQVQFNAGDSIPLQGREYIRITGNQVQAGKTSYAEGIRTVAAEWYMNILFTQKIGQWNSIQVVQIVIDRTVFNLIPLSENVISVTASDISKTNEQNHYNVQFKQDTTYLNENGIMLKIMKKEGTMTAYLVGIKRYDNIILRKI